MTNVKVAYARGLEMREEAISPTEIPATQRRDGLRHHVINRMSQERSGRLYCPYDWDFEIPSLDIYAAR